MFVSGRLLPVTLVCRRRSYLVLFTANEIEAIKGRFSGGCLFFGRGGVIHYFNNNN